MGLRHRRLALAIASAILLLAVMAWVRAEGLGALPPAADAGEWVVYPLEPRVGARPGTPLVVIFSASVEADPTDSSVELRLQCLGSATVRLGGRPVATARGCAGGRVATLDLAAPLAGTGVGPRRLEIEIARADGPPAAAFAVRAQRSAGWHRLLASEDGKSEIVASLDGLAPSPPRLAGARPLPASARVMPEVTGPWPAAMGAWIVVSLLMGAVLGWFVVEPNSDSSKTPWRRLRERLQGLLRRAPQWLEVTAVGIGLLVFTGLCTANAVPHLAPTLGFDAEGHWEYIGHLATTGELPRADEGWQMYHPPLYHAVAALWLRGGGHDLSTFAGDGPVTAAPAASLRWLGALLSALQMGLFLAFAALMVEGEKGSVTKYALALTTLFAMALPIHNYPFRYISNEPLAGVLSAATLVAAALLLTRPRPTVAGAAGLGGLWGLALATKVSTLMLAPPLALAFGWRLWAGRRRGEAGASGPGALRGVVVAGLAFAAAAALVGGWHYLRLWRDFGSPLVGNWSPQLGFDWWQDPGLRSVSDYLPSGRSLGQPFFAGFSSVPDGLWGTLWADGLVGGQRSLGAGPPWIWPLQAMASVLALVPTAVVLVGCGVLAIGRWRRALSSSASSVSSVSSVVSDGSVRTCREARLWLAGSALASAVAALVAATVGVPSYAQSKAFYILPAAAALGGIFALGGAAVARRGGVRWGAAVGALVAAWALVSLGSFWVLPTPATHLAHGRALLASGDGESAEAAFAKVVEQEHEATPAQLAEAYAGAAAAVLSDGRRGAGTQLLHLALDLEPDQPEALRLEAVRLYTAGRPAAALLLAERAVAIDGPVRGDASAWQLVARLRYESGDAAGAAEALAEALRRAPEDRETRLALESLAAVGLPGGTGR